MTDYYAQVHKGGVWHRRWKYDQVMCGWSMPIEYIGPTAMDWQRQPWVGESTEPHEPLRKHYQRSKR